MSIRGRGPHTIVVQPRKVTRNDAGRQVKVNDGPPVRITRCSVQSVREWATAEEVLEYGLQLISMRRVFTRFWPGDVHGLVYFDGGEFEIVGDPQHMDQSRRTTHWVTTIRWVGNAEPPVIPSDTPEPGDDEPGTELGDSSDDEEVSDGDG